MDERDALKALGEETFWREAHQDRPSCLYAGVEAYLDTATASVGVVVSATERAAYWLDGRSLGILCCTGTDDNDIKHIGGEIHQLDHVSAVDLAVDIHHDSGGHLYTGRQLVIGDPNRPDIMLDASPGRFPPDKCVQIEQFIDQVLAALAGR